jgi:hypothetical protein
MDMVYAQPGQFTWTDAGSLFNGSAGGGIASGSIIKEDLFYYCTNVRTFSSIFQANRNISSLPENMFNRCYRGELFGSAFFGATGPIDGLCTLPSGSGFFPSSSYTGFYNMSGTFFNFRNLDILYSSSFDNLITAKNTKQGGYMYAYRMFETTGTNTITGQAPAIWTYPPNGTAPYGVQAFRNCTNLSNYADIPAGFK